MNVHRPLVALIMLVALLSLAACGKTAATGSTHAGDSAAMTGGDPPMDHASMPQATVTPHTSQTAADTTVTPHTSQTAADATSTPHMPAPARPSLTPNETQAVQVVASEFAFAFSQTTFVTNTPYRFVIENRGVVPHEWVLMAPGEDHVHDDHASTLGAVRAADLPGGATVSRDMTFTEPGIFEVACKLPGHYEAGMKITITVQ